MYANGVTQPGPLASEAGPSPPPGMGEPPSPDSLPDMPPGMPPPQPSFLQLGELALGITLKLLKLGPRTWQAGGPWAGAGRLSKSEEGFILSLPGKIRWRAGEA